MITPNSPTYPIILVHGVIRFDVVGSRVFKKDKHPSMDGVGYFRQIRPLLSSHGFVVEIVNLRFCASADTQAELLHKFILEVLAKHKAQKVHLICHSFGGIVARHVLWNYQDTGIIDRIASVTTMGTPHFGTTHAITVLNSILGQSYRHFLSNLSPPMKLESLGFPSQAFMNAYYSHSNDQDVMKGVMDEIASNGISMDPSPLPPMNSLARSINTPPLPEIQFSTNPLFTPSLSLSPTTPNGTSPQITRANMNSSPHLSIPASPSLLTFPYSFLASLGPATHDPTSPTFGIVYPPSRPSHNIHLMFLDITAALDMLPVHSLAYDLQVRDFEKSIPVKFMTIAGDMNLDWIGNENDEKEEKNTDVPPTPERNTFTPFLSPSPSLTPPSADTPIFTTPTRQRQPLSPSSSTTPPSRAASPSSPSNSFTEHVLSSPHSILLGTEGPNDGLVGVVSAKWREEYFTEPVLPFDHQSLTGAAFPFERLITKGRVKERLELVQGVWLKQAFRLADLFPVMGERKEEEGREESGEGREMQETLQLKQGQTEAEQTHNPSPPETSTTPNDSPPTLRRKFGSRAPQTQPEVDLSSSVDSHLD
ncbi:putative triacylglycerol lipase [Blattamonas nauphoetae]|uniref:Triacylglycerol lipase n=1 Tax=Blattamonas nauphoetae TaxID=2049346 RepID=A0ABQ9XFY6_9EUKA|nr:putative triacylglycerol lipase [Blattamonas nauphoetae]